MRAVLILMGMASFCWAQSGIGTPQLGFITDGNRSVRPVQGLAGNFLLGDPVGEDGLSSASSGAYAMVKTASSVLVLDRQGQIQYALDTEDGPALFAFTADGSPAMVFLPGSGALLTWRDGRMDRLQVSQDLLNGKPISLAGGGPGTARFLIERPDGIWQVEISASTGEPTDMRSLPGVCAPALQTADGQLFSIQGLTLVMRNAAGGERRLDLGFQAAAIEVLGAGWLQLNERDTTRQFAVRTVPGREQTFQLPEAQP